MNKELSIILKDKIANLPFVDVLAGLVQTIEDAQPQEEGATVRSKFPMAVDSNIIGCSTGQERALVPDSSRRSIIYFEDFGSNIGREGRNGRFNFTSQLRLVCWLNREKLVGDNYANLTGYCIAKICARLDIKFLNIGMFQRLTVRPVRIPVQDASIFSRYSYEETVRQYLMPPFDVFAIDFSCESYVAAGCLPDINFSNGSEC